MRIFVIALTLVLLGCQPSGFSTAGKNSEVTMVARFSTPTDTRWLRMCRSTMYGDSFKAFGQQLESRTYKTSELLPLLPKGEVAVGDTWELDKPTITKILSQFHPGARNELNMDGEGAFGVVQAQKGSLLKLRLRIHAQFVLESNVFLTPAMLSGVMVFDRETQTFQEFSLEVPVENELNLGYEVLKGDRVVGMSKTDAMSLSLSTKPSAQLTWGGLSDEEATRVLEKAFYSFAKIDWRGFEEGVSEAGESGKPLFIVVVAGVLNDQSC